MITFKRFFLIVFFIFSAMSGFMIGIAFATTVPFNYQNVTPQNQWSCSGGTVSYSLDVVTYSSVVTEVVREWESESGWYRPAGSFDVVVETDRTPWQLFIEPNRRTFYETVTVPEDAPIGMIQFQQGAHSGLFWDEVFTFDVEVRECDEES